MNGIRLTGGFNDNRAYNQAPTNVAIDFADFARGSYVMTRYRRDNCAHTLYLSTREGHINYNVSANPNYRGLCTNANVIGTTLPGDPPDATIYNGGLEAWESYRFQGDGFSKMCVYKGHNCEGEWFEVKASDECRLLSDPYDWNYISYYILPIEASCSNENKQDYPTKLSLEGRVCILSFG